MCKIAREGYPFILLFVLLAILTAVVGEAWMISIPLAIALFMAFFFRDPERITLEGRGVFYAPADGKVILIRESEERRSD